MDVMAIDIENVSVLARYFLLASGNSTTQVSALAEEIQAKLSEKGVEPLRVEGTRAAMWIVLDYGDLMIHIFHRETRQFYNLERLWADGKTILPAQLLGGETPARPEPTV
jgi:ribosome-associated protein